jgi:hypothetical protein
VDSVRYWRKRVYLSSLMGMWICSIIFGNRRSGDEETPSVPLFRGKKCEASLGLPEGRRMMYDVDG